MIKMQGCFSCGTEDVSTYLAQVGFGEVEEVSCCDECYEDNEGFDGEVRIFLKNHLSCGLIFSYILLHKKVT